MRVILDNARRSFIERGEYDGIALNGLEDAGTLCQVWNGEYDDLAIAPGDTVLDVGANIGIFALWALERGAKYVVCVEPYPPNVRRLHHNLRDVMSSVVILEGAVTAEESGDTELHVNLDTPYSGVTPRTTRSFRNSVPVKVPTFSIENLVCTYGPQRVKLDAEESEWELLPLISSSVARVTAEMHFSHICHGLSAVEAVEKIGLVVGELESGMLLRGFTPTAPHSAPRHRGGYHRVWTWRS